MAGEIDLAQVAEKVAGDVHGKLALNDALHSETIRTLGAEHKQATADILAAGRQLEADRAELRSKRDLMPAAGFQRLNAEAEREAQAKMDDAYRRAERAHEAIKAQALTDAQPTFDSAREALARQEFSAAIGEASGSKAGMRLLDIVQRGSREAAAIAFTGFGRTVLESRGLTGKELEDALQSAKRVAADVALTSPQNERQLLAAALYRDADSLGAVRGAAGSYTARVLRQSTPIY